MQKLHLSSETNKKKKVKSQSIHILFCLLFLLISDLCFSTEAEDHKILIEMETSLKSELLDIWYPIALDTLYGGFLSDFTYDWQPQGPQNKMIVTQTRHVWTASEAALFYRDDRFRKIADHGFHFLKTKMWDRTNGGFYTLLNRRGNPIGKGYWKGKTAYGNAFAIYALATYYTMSGDTSALNLAKETFSWLDEHSRDPDYKGYLNMLNQDGSWSEGNLWKDQNSSIHLLEAFTALYRVWPDSLLRQRLLEMLFLIRDTITTKKGYLTLFMERDWTTISFRDSSEAVRKRNVYFDHVSFGHDMETAYLMLEASHVLELQANETTLYIAQNMVDHALTKGWDDEKGGFFEAGYYFTDSDTITIINDTKTWWAQGEGLHALLLMARLFPDENKYIQAFRKQWQYINTYLIDHKFGGWYEEGFDKSPEQRRAPKASIWKINYHNVRALMNCIKMLKSESE
jgi:mannobiose 2-epimerase